MRVCLVDVFLPNGFFFNMVMCVDLVVLCWPWSCMLALEMHVVLVYMYGYSG